MTNGRDNDLVVKYIIREIEYGCLDDNSGSLTKERVIEWALVQLGEAPLGGCSVCQIPIDRQKSTRRLHRDRKPLLGYFRISEWLRVRR